ncbi:TPA: hypothetical protein HA265_00400, partial [Candidatus Woesearchaeota archaeon]|nr:hypothetical protein [Candidatus Woesearchaeota archaeon]
MKKTIFLTILLLLATVLATGVSALTEVVPIQRSGDVLELNELLGDVTETLDASDAPVALGTYHLSNGMGVTDVNTYLRLQWDWPPEYAQAKVVYDKDDDDNVGDFLWFEDGEEAFTFELEFANGLRSNISANGDLNDFIGLDLRIFGEFFTIMAANYQPATGLSMTLASPVKIVELEDADPAQVFSGNVVINSEAIEDADVDFYFNTNFGYFMLSKMRYRLYTDGIGGYEPYIAPGQG